MSEAPIRGQVSRERSRWLKIFYWILRYAQYDEVPHLIICLFAALFICYPLIVAPDA